MTSLSDFEFRVWWTYELAADDYGVMRCSAVAIQAANDALAKRPSRLIEKALQVLIDIGLLVVFLHQQRRYVCQLNWQDFQKVRYPRESHEPCPPPEILRVCSGATQELFRNRSGNVLERDPNSSGRARTREEANANGLRQTANGSAREREMLLLEQGTAAARFCERFVELYAQHRRGAHYHLKPSLDWSRVCELLQTYEAAHLEKLAEILLTSDDEWIAKTDRGIGVLVAKVSWCEDRLRAWEHDQIETK